MSFRLPLLLLTVFAVHGSPAFATDDSPGGRTPHRTVSEGTCLAAGVTLSDGTTTLRVKISRIHHVDPPGVTLMAPDGTGGWVAQSDAAGTSIEVVCDPVDFEIALQDSAGQALQVSTSWASATGTFEFFIPASLGHARLRLAVAGHDGITPVPFSVDGLVFKEEPGYRMPVMRLPATPAQAVPPREVRLEISRRLFAEGRLQEADSLLASMGEADAVILNNRAAVLAKLGRFGEAMSLLEQALPWAGIARLDDVIDLYGKLPSTDTNAAWAGCDLTLEAVILNNMDWVAADKARAGSTAPQEPPPADNPDSNLVNPILR